MKLSLIFPGHAFSDLFSDWEISEATFHAWHFPHRAAIIISA